MKDKQPTAIAFTRTQESWAEFVLAKVRANIVAREAQLRENEGYSEEDLHIDEELMDLYDDELFYERYSAEMQKQRAFIRKKYFGEEE